MPLTPELRAKLDRLGLTEVLLHYERADPHNYRSTLTTLEGAPARGDVGEWIAEKEREATHIVAQTLFWAKAAALIGVFGVVVAIIIAALGK